MLLEFPSGPGTRVVQFRVEVATLPLPVGTLPRGKRLVLKDFLSSPLTSANDARAVVLEVCADGEVVAEIPVDPMSGCLNTHLTGGIVIRGSRELALRLTAGSGAITVSGILEDND